MQSIDEMIQQHEFLISRAIYKLNIYQNKEDYMQIGRISLWKAVLDFDESKGEFSMFAYVRIRYALLRALTNANKIEQVEVALESNKLVLILEKQSAEEIYLPPIDWPQLLNDEEYSLIQMIYVDGKTLREVALHLGYSYEMVKKENNVY